MSSEAEDDASSQDASGSIFISKPVSQLAHDIRNHLNVIACAVQFMIGAPVEKQEKYAERVQQAIDLCTRLCNETLDRSTPHRFDLNEVLPQIIDRLRTGIETPRIKVSLNLCEGQLPIRLVISDLEQILQNVLLNAAEAMSSGGRIHVETSVHYLPESLNASARWARMTITDEGDGMDEETLSKLFRPYFTTKELGHGIGLMIVHELVSRNGGRIDVTSRIRAGTQFQIMLRCTDMPQR